MVDFEFTTIAQVEPRLYRPHADDEWRLKAYSMTGWRTGYAGGPQWLIKAMSNDGTDDLRTHVRSRNGPRLKRWNGTQDFIPKNKKLFQERRDLVVSMLNQARHQVPDARGRVLCISIDRRADR